MFQWLQFSGVKEFKQQIRMKYANILYSFYSIKLIWMYSSDSAMHSLCFMWF